VSQSRLRSCLALLHRCCAENKVGTLLWFATQCSAEIGPASYLDYLPVPAALHVEQPHPFLSCIHAIFLFKRSILQEFLHLTLCQPLRRHCMKEQPGFLTGLHMLATLPIHSWRAGSIRLLYRLQPSLSTSASLRYTTFGDVYTHTRFFPLQLVRYGSREEYLRGWAKNGNRCQELGCTSARVLQPVNTPHPLRRHLRLTDSLTADLVVAAARLVFREFMLCYQKLSIVALCLYLHQHARRLPGTRRRAARRPF
jgi:hypothetical protein